MDNCECDQLNLTNGYRKYDDVALRPFDYLVKDDRFVDAFGLESYKHKDKAPHHNNNKRSMDKNDIKKDLQELQKNRLANNNYPFFRPIDTYELHQSLFQALAFPELAKGIKLPTEFQIPTYCFQQKTSFTVATNASGNALIEINLGQYLDSTIFGGVTNRSNVFVNNNALLDGTTVQLAANYTPINALSVNTGTFTSVRASTQCVKLEYIGRLDIAAGDITAGVAYSNVGVDSGVLPDVNYSILSSIEDSSFSRTVPITTSLRGIFVPQDYNTLNFKSPTDTNPNIAQRMFFLILAAPPSQTIMRVTLVMNWEATPSRQFSDLLTVDYNTFPASFSGNLLYDYIIKNNLVITQNDSEFGKYTFLEQIKRY